MAPLAPRDDVLRPEQSEAPLVAIRGRIGCIVHGRNGFKGRLKDVFFDTRSARILYAVVGVGGVLGYGEQLAALPWSLLRFDPRLNVFTASGFSGDATIEVDQAGGAEGAGPRPSETTSAVGAGSLIDVMPQQPA